MPLDLQGRRCVVSSLQTLASIALCNWVLQERVPLALSSERARNGKHIITVEYLTSVGVPALLATEAIARCTGHMLCCAGHYYTCISGGCTFTRARTTPYPRLDVTLKHGFILLCNSHVKQLRHADESASRARKRRRGEDVD